MVATVDNANYAGTSTASLVIAEPPPPEIVFDASVTVGLSPLPVTFTESSTGFVGTRVLEAFDDDEQLRVIDPSEPVDKIYSTPGQF